MKHYRVLIHGQNFIVEAESGLVNRGFYTTRFVMANDHDHAEQNAVQMLRDFAGLKELVRNPEDNRPELIIEETQELESFEGLNELEPGLAWYESE